MAYIVLKSNKKRVWMMLSIIAFLLIQPALGFLAFLGNSLQLFSSSFTSYLSQVLKVNLSPINWDGWNALNNGHLHYQLLTVLPYHMNNVLHLMVLGILCFFTLYHFAKDLLLVHHDCENVEMSKNEQNEWICFAKPCFLFAKPNEKMTA